MPNSTWALDLYAKLPNLAITSLASNVNEQHEVEVADLVLVRRTFKSFLETRITKHTPDVVGLSAMSYQAKAARYISRFIKRLDPEIKVILGGYHATTMAEEVGQAWGTDLDFIIRGEGESTFRQLLQSLDTGGPDFHEIKGLSFKKYDTFIHNPRQELEDLCLIKKPKRSSRILKDGFHTFGLNADVIESSRGCLNNCKFCSIQKMYGRSFRKFPLDRTLSEIDSCSKNGVRSITFVDDNINMDADHFSSLCDGIIEWGLNDIHYSIQASVKGLYDKPTLLKKLVDANFKFVFLGIESHNTRNLKLYGKKIKEMARKAKSLVSYLRNHNILVAGGFITGNPDDTSKDFYNVLDYAKEIKVDLAIFSALQPYPETEIREILLDRNLVFNVDDFSRYDGVTHNARTTYLTRKQVEILRERLWTGFYDIDWLIWNNFRRIYPAYFMKLFLQIAPRIMKSAFYEITRLRSPYEIVQQILQYEKDFRDLKR